MKHERKCWECVNISVHLDNVVPYVRCFKCNSQDTRPTKKQSPSLTETITWIPVSERLPDDDLLVLTFIAGEVYPGHTLDGDWYWERNHKPSPQPTHWAEMPKGPSV